LFCLRSDIKVEQQHFLCGIFNSYVLNAIVRMLMGSHVTTSLVEGLPVPPWTGSRSQRRIARLAARLQRSRGHTKAHALLQAAAARVYGLDREAFGAVLDSFPLVPIADRKDAYAALSGSPRITS